MKNFKSLALTLLAMAALSLSSCLHVLEELTVKANGSGSYSMTLDMSEMKGMMDMMKGMVPDSLSADSLGGAAAADESNPMTQMGTELTAVAKSLEGVKGLTNIREINDTTNFKFGYAFDFENAEALNKALQIVAKEKFDSKNPETFKLEKKKFVRNSSGDFGAELKKQLSESGDEGGDEQMEMVKMFFADMTYKQVYHFEKKVKKSSNSLSEISEDGQTVTITIKPFDEEQAKSSPTVATEIKLK